MAKEENAEGAPQLFMDLHPHPALVEIGKRQRELSARAFALVGYLFEIPQPSNDVQRDMLAQLSELADEYGELVDEGIDNGSRSQA